MTSKINTTPKRIITTKKRMIPRMKTTPKVINYLQNNDVFKIQKAPINDDNSKNENNPTNEDDLKKQDNSKN